MPEKPSSLGPVLVTGANGFCASHIIEKLLLEYPGTEIHGLDVLTGRFVFPGVTYHYGNISRREDVDDIMDIARPVTIFHLASPEFSNVPIERFHAIVVDGTQYLLDACKRLSTVKAFVHCSTSSAINDNRSNMIDGREDWPVLRYPQQKRPYSLCKVEADDLIMAANRVDGDSSMLCTNIRPSLVFGERDVASLSRMVESALQGKARFQLGDGKNPYDFIYAGNLADLHLVIAERLHAAWGKPASTDIDTRVDGETFNATNDDPWFFWDFQRAVSAAAGKPVKKEEVFAMPTWAAMTMGFVLEWVMWIISFGKRRPILNREAIRFSTLQRTLSCEKSKRVLGFRAKVGMQEGIERGVTWVMEHRDETVMP